MFDTPINKRIMQRVSRRKDLEIWKDGVTCSRTSLAVSPLRYIRKDVRHNALRASKKRAAFMRIEIAEVKLQGPFAGGSIGIKSGQPVIVFQGRGTGGTLNSLPDRFTDGWQSVKVEQILVERSANWCKLTLYF